MVDLDQIRQNLLNMGMTEEEVPQPKPMSEMPTYMRLLFPQMRAGALNDIDKALQAMQPGSNWEIQIDMGGATIGGFTLHVETVTPSEITGTGCAEQTQEDGGEERPLRLEKVGDAWFAHGVTEYDEECEDIRVIGCHEPLELETD